MNNLACSGEYYSQFTDAKSKSTVGLSDFPKVTHQVSVGKRIALTTPVSHSCAQATRTNVQQMLWETKGYHNAFRVEWLS